MGKVDMLPDELVMYLFWFVDTRSLVTRVPAVCNRWRRLCGEVPIHNGRVRGFLFDLDFLTTNSRVKNGQGADILRMLSQRWKWVDAVLVDEWPLGRDSVKLFDFWPKLVLTR